MSDWTTSDLKERSIAATEYTDYANVPVGDETYELPYGLLNQQEQLNVQSKIEMSSIAEAQGDVDVSDETKDAEETIQELQSKDEDLTEGEKAALRDAQTTLAQNRGELIDAMGKQTLMAFYDAGKSAITPDKEDVDNVLDNPIEARDRFTDIDGAPTPEGGSYTRESARRALRKEMIAILEPSPFMVFFTIGQQVWKESQSAGELVGSSEDEM